MATSDTYTLVISEVGIPSSHAASHTAGGGDEIAVNISQLDDIAANTVLGNLTGATAAVTAVATTGTGNVVRATGPTITLANATGLPLTTGVTGVLPAANGGTGVSALGTGVATFLGTPTSANLRGAITDETGTGSLVFGTSPTITSPTISGSPTFSTPLSTSNGGTGVVISDFMQDFLEIGSSLTLRAAVSDETGSGSLVFGTSPTLTTPTINGGNLSGVNFSDVPTFDYPLTPANGGTGLDTLATGIQTFLGSGTSSSLRGAITDETGTGSLVFGTSPTIDSPSITGSPTFATPLSVANGGTGFNTASYGELSMQGGSATQTVTASVFAKATGAATTLGLASNFDAGGSSYKLRYTGTATRKFIVYTDVNITTVAAGETIAIALAHNGSVIAQSESRANSGSAADVPENNHITYIGTSWMLELAQNDYIELYVTAYVTTATQDIIIRRCQMVVHAVV